jgi:hypothetical protein
MKEFLVEPKADWKMIQIWENARPLTTMGKAELGALIAVLQDAHKKMRD